MPRPFKNVDGQELRVDGNDLKSPTLNNHLSTINRLEPERGRIKGKRGKKRKMGMLKTHSLTLTLSPRRGNSYRSPQLLSDCQQTHNSQLLEQRKQFSFSSGEKAGMRANNLFSRFNDALRQVAEKTKVFPIQVARNWRTAPR